MKPHLNRHVVAIMLTALALIAWLAPALASAAATGLVLAPLYSGTAALSAASASTATTKTLGSNFSIVNLSTAANQVSLQYVKPDGTQWRSPETYLLQTQGSQVIRRQYDDPTLTGTRGSAVVSAPGPLGGVGQILARGQVPTSGAYSAALVGAQTVYIPLVAKGGATASGTANSQITVLNMEASAATFTIRLIDATGNTVRTTDVAVLNGGASFIYDATVDTALPNGFYSAVVQAASGGRVSANSNLFIGANSLLTFSGFTATAQKWKIPLFASRLQNGLSTPISVQNLSGATIPAGGIKLSCLVNPGSSGENFSQSNTVAVNHSASYFFNPVVDGALPSDWYGACTVETTGYNTVAFVQMRFVGTDKAAGYEALRADGTKTKVIVPLYAKRLANGFATAVTIQNLSESNATVNIAYIASDGQPANCSAPIGPLMIPAGGNLIQNHRITSGPNSVPQLPDTCVGSMIVTANQPIDAFVQMDTLDVDSGDTFMAHNAFTAD